jgi:PAS domain S-box-containing protein
MELRSKLLWLIVLRLLIATALLGSVALMDIVPQIVNLTLLLLVGIYFFSLVSLLVWRSTRRYEGLLYLQIAVDLLFVSLLIFYTNGIDSTFTSLYMVVIVYASILLGKRGGITAAILSGIFFLVTIWTGYLMGVTSLAGSQWKMVYLKLLLVLLGFVSLVYLIVYLFERVKLTKLELEETSTSLGDLQALNENIITSIRSGLITTDLSGNIITFNGGAAEITGHREPMRGKHVSTVIGDWLWGKILGTNFSKERDPLRCELQRKTQQGKDIYLGAGATPLCTKKGTHIGYIISFLELFRFRKILE